MTFPAHIPARPTRLTAEMKQRAAAAVVTNLISEGHLDESERDHAIRSIARYGQAFMDGYHLARELDRYGGWDCNLDMAETLDGWSAACDEEIKAAQKEWAEANNIQPPFPVGARVVARWGGEDHPGTIENISTYDVARYGVKRDGETGNWLMVVNFEDVRALEAEAASE